MFLSSRYFLFINEANYYSNGLFTLLDIFAFKVWTISHAKKVMSQLFGFHDGLIILPFGFLTIILLALRSRSRVLRISTNVLAWRWEVKA